MTESATARFIETLAAMRGRTGSAPIMGHAPDSVTEESAAVAESVQSPGDGRMDRPRNQPSGNRRRYLESASRPTPSLDRVLAFLRAEIGAGRGFPVPAAIARYMGWKSERSARDSLRRLEGLGLVRCLGVEQRKGGEPFGAGRLIWEVTLAGQAPAHKWCRRCIAKKPAAAFAHSEAHADGLAPVCMSCSTATKNDPEARAAA